MDIYVGNLPWSASEQELSDSFGEFGTVEKATIIVDRESGRSKGFGFVTMNDNEEANNAIEALNGTDFGGRALKVNEARPREERPPRRDNW
ncbi:MAG: RNA-binding protein [Opitutae bacterium]|jgi:RNA recognition motif-containing protein|nr:RNA-binding protein [Opitutae bacterium]|tara:strand:- start:4283 stop:4555 length:273 start_codon:yes stop_codon:yes gene_type:complete